MNLFVPAVLGLDFGTESVRAHFVDLDGTELGSAVSRYRHGQITDALPSTGERLPPGFALQHPEDWINSAAEAVREVVDSGRCDPARVVGIGVDFTSCTMLPVRRDGIPLCIDARFAGEKFAWPKLWKHHGAKTQTERINHVARSRHESWLDRYGGTVGLEWFFPKVLETLESAPHVYRSADVWLEAGDWFTWQLVGGDAANLPRSTCQAGYKGMWHKQHGFPSREFFAQLHPELVDVVAEKMPGKFVAPGEQAGELIEGMARRMGLPPGISVSAATIDAHAGVPGAGAALPGTLVMVLGTSSCHMLNATVERSVPGVAGVVEDGILPGYFGYETGQAAVGDAFDWLRRTLGQPSFDSLTAQAAGLPAGSDGVLCMDWFNGCRTPLMDGSLRGALVGLTLNHGPHHIYRAAIEASACGLRWIIEILRDSGVPVERLLASGGLPHHNALLVQIYADVLGEPVSVHPCRQGSALGAAILGALAAGERATGFGAATEAIHRMAGPRAGVAGRELLTVAPRANARTEYDQLYRRYRQLADMLSRLA